MLWVYHAKRPMTVDELQHAIAIEGTEKELDTENLRKPQTIVDVCLGLVSVEHESHTIRLFHLTLKEYFDSYGSLIFPNPDKDILRSCLAYLSFDTFSEGPCEDQDSLIQREHKHPFLAYASIHWGHHARADLDSDSLESVFQFLDRTMNVSCSVQVSDTYPGIHYDSFPKSLTPFHMVCKYGSTWQ